MPIDNKLWKRALVLPLAFCCVLALPAFSQAQSAPQYKFDPDWPKTPAEQVEDGRRHGFGRG